MAEESALSFSQYHEQAKATNICPSMGDGYLPVYEAMGLSGEAGEALEKVKKGWRDGTFDLEGYIYKLGDVLWYLNASAEKVGFTLEEVAEVNINKLRSRHARGVISGEGDHR
jgi:NTP pyrophosphatase (non-canonical NTP hydrolase)